MSTENPLAEYDAQIEALRTQLAPLQAQLRATSAEKREYADLLAHETDDPQVLMALREESQVAYSKLVKHVRETTHPAIWNFCDWQPVGDDYSVPMVMGPELSLSKDADDEYVSDLHASLLDFATRFCNPAPAVVIRNDQYDDEIDRSGMVFAPILTVDDDEGPFTSYALWYAPDGSKAYLTDAYARYTYDPPESNLSDMLRHAAKVAHNGR